MLTRFLLVGVAAAMFMLLATSCHTMRFELADAPHTQAVTERKSFWFWGLTSVQVDVQEKCPNGTVAVMEETTFVDGLLSLPTLGIWSPRSSTYYCADAAEGKQ
jgi:hypothetical protein